MQHFRQNIERLIKYAFWRTAQNNITSIKHDIQKLNMLIPPLKVKRCLKV
ncbi:Hypothetical protein CINCED_3A022937 [Cinara cedri]|nr:Hypothetical protein CINCED_3A022937 [Cinara cedri]